MELAQNRRSGNLFRVKVQLRASLRALKNPLAIKKNGKIEKIGLQQLPISTPNLSALGKLDLLVWIYTRA